MNTPRLATDVGAPSEREAMATRLLHAHSPVEVADAMYLGVYQIAALASSVDTSERFYRHVHAIIGELLNAQNFFIALASEDGQTVSFPYAIDQRQGCWKAIARTWSD